MTIITFDQGNVRFVLRVAAIIIENGKVLLNQSNSNENFWFIPGGRAELLETSEESLRREMREELEAEVEVERLLWVEERMFAHDGFDIHAVVLYYRVHLPVDSPLHDHNAEYHFKDGDTPCLCKWHNLDDLDRIGLYQEFWRDALRRLPDSPQHIVFRETQPS
jgi:8-oxo-dGTP pyrophosphatase MutT (NUDIX family)